jgi:hypothetical protein
MSAPLDPKARAKQRVRLVPLIVYATAMGWLEGVVVVYLRGLLGIARTSGIPKADEVMHRLGSLPWLLGTEQTREICTIAMLVAVALIAAERPLARFGAFLVAFGVWDITYYIALYALLGWPASLDTMDLLFLIPPHPLWYQPVWIPITISCGMIALGLRLIVNRTPGVT